MTHAGGAGFPPLDGWDADTLRAVFQLTPSVLSITSLDDGRILDVNDAFLQITGYSRDEILGRTVTELDLWVHPEQRREGLAALVAGEKIRGVEAHFRMKGGEERVMLLAGEMMTVGGRRVVVTALTDITERKRLEAQSEARREEAEALAEAARLLARSLDLKVVAAEIVQSVRRLLGSKAAVLTLLEGDALTVQAVVGAGPLWQPGVTIPRGLALAWRAIHARRVVTASDLLADPEVRWTEELRERVEAGNYQVGLAAPLLASGRVVGVLSLGDESGRTYTDRDVELVEAFAAHAAVAVANARLFRDVAAANRGKDQFLAMLGHELRNPLGTIANAAQVLDRLAHDETARGVTRIVHRQVGLLSRLVDDLLDVARAASGKIALDRRLVDLGEVASRCLDSLSHAGRLGAHAVEVEAGSVLVAGDPARLEQVVANLVDNALKYTPAGGRIAISTRQHGSEAVLRVADTGSGIRAELLPTIFDLFTQEPQALDRSRGGLGLGLALVKRLVELHGGTVSVTSAGLEQGTEVTVRIPAQRSDVRAAEAAPAKEDAAPRRRVLLVEDNADARESLRMLLALLGHDVVEAEDGPSALRKLAEHRPDIALIDVGLPLLDGYEVARRARADRELAHLCLVAVTGYGQAEDRARAREAGFDRHLTKPVDPEMLYSLLRVEPERSARSRGA